MEDYLGLTKICKPSIWNELIQAFSEEPEEDNGNIHDEKYYQNEGLNLIQSLLSLLIFN